MAEGLRAHGESEAMNEISDHFLKKLLIILLLFVFFSVSSPAVSVEVYSWKDKNGNIFFSDKPPSADKNAEVRTFKDDPEPNFRTTPKVDSQKPKSGGTEEKTSLSSQKPKSKSPERKRSYSNINVIVYSTSWCGYCRKAKEYLRSLNVNLVEYDIEKDPGKAKEMLSKSRGSTGVPLIDVEGIIIQGYSQRAIEDAVEKRRTL
jgi:glutaredoxin